MQVIDLVRFLSQQDPHAEVVIWHCDNPAGEDDAELLEYDIVDTGFSPTGDIILSTDPIDDD